MKSFAILLSLVAVASAQFYQPLAYHGYGEVPAAHPEVVENAIRESQYPSEYQNNFYKNPHIAAALAKESLLTEKEMPVYDRAADKIPRDQIFKIFRGAGWIRRR